MATFTNSISKCCVTCEFWGGIREAKAMGRQVAYRLRPSDSSEGICGNKVALKRGKAVPANYTGCSKYTKWSTLK